MDIQKYKTYKIYKVVKMRLMNILDKILKILLIGHLFQLKLKLYQELIINIHIQIMITKKFNLLYMINHGLKPDKLRLLKEMKLKKMIKEKWLILKEEFKLVMDPLTKLLKIY